MVEKLMRKFMSFPLKYYSNTFRCLKTISILDIFKTIYLNNSDLHFKSLKFVFPPSPLNKYEKMLPPPSNAFSKSPNMAELFQRQKFHLKQHVAPFANSAGSWEKAVQARKKGKPLPCSNSFVLPFSLFLLFREYFQEKTNKSVQAGT